MDAHHSHINFKRQPQQKSRDKIIALNKTYCLFGKKLDVEVYKDEIKEFRKDIKTIYQNDKIKISNNFKNNNKKKNNQINYVKLNTGLFEKTNEINGYKFK